ncbi:MAG TPA: LysR substrate-binding domain-containing protein [Roseiflexaceae bacterium]|nr:LysR substrate-binding domain-containing protein [Roseiflexaceae bacterium]HMP40794.1 LysR substrate-binding domain-containing protein [Roseiflexaceae bacterium]
MELRHLRYFEAVARHQHVSRAAAELTIAQPALSKQIRELEKELGGIALFERAGRSIRLTDAGDAFLVRARAILALVDAARDEMHERLGMRSGRVTVGAPPTVGVRLLPEVLAAFHAHYPQVELRVREGGTQALSTMLFNGEIDLAVVTLPATQRGLRLTPLFTEQLVIVAARDHPLAGCTQIPFAALADEPFLLYPPGYEMRDVTLAACRRAGFTPRVVLDGGDMDMLLRLAEAGLGITLIAPLALGGERLAVLPIADQQLQRTMALAMRDDPAIAPATRELHEFLAQRLRRSA